MKTAFNNVEIAMRNFFNARNRGASEEEITRLGEICVAATNAYVDSLKNGEEDVVIDEEETFEECLDKYEAALEAYDEAEDNDADAEELDRLWAEANDIGLRLFNMDEERADQYLR